jgi:ferredoxin
LCGIEDGTIVAAHSNQQIHGKGMGVKAHDCYVAALCFKCHAQIDQGTLYDKATKKDMWDLAFQRTILELWKREMIKVA